MAFLQVPLVDLVGGHGGGHGVVETLLPQRTFSLTWAIHLSDCRYASDFGRRRISAVRSESRNSSGPVESPHAHGARADSLEDVCVGACALEQAVLAREAQRLVVERVAEQPRVVDLEDVDLRDVAVQRRRVGDRVETVERVREIDEAALLADRGDRVGEGHPARDLLLEEQPDHLALTVRLHLLAGDHDEVAARAASTASRAPPKTLWSVTAMPPRPIPSACSTSSSGGDGAVVRPLRVHVEVDGDPLAVGERVVLARRPAPALSA